MSESLRTRAIRQRVTVSCLLSGIMMLAACGGGDDGCGIVRGCGAEPPVTPPVTISISPTALTVSQGASGLLVVTISGGSTASPPTLVECRSEASALVSTAVQGGNCRVTGVAPGSTTVTATASTGQQAAAGVTVTSSAPLPTALTDLQVAPSAASLTVGQSRALSATPTIGGAGVVVSYSYASSNTSVATVSTLGVVTALAAGSTTITVTATGIGVGFTTSQRAATVSITVTSVVAPTPTVVLSGSITSNRTLTADTNYILRGFVFVGNGATLSVSPGTRIVGDTTAAGSSLFILRGSQISAVGTASAPIVFTSQRSAGNRAPGDWGGLVIIGNARGNRTGSVILAGSDGSVVGASPSGIVYTGGTADSDNSGTLRYVRVEFAGYAPGVDQELSSITLASVGNGTTVEYVQALAGLNDGFEWLGGTVNGRYLVSYEAGDDHFDAAEGYRGLNQFLIGLQTTSLTPRAGAGAVSTDPFGLEIDGCSGIVGCVAPSGGSTQSAGRDNGLWNMGVFANFTLVGTPTSVSVPAGGGVGAVLRRGTGGYYINGVITRWPRGAISLRDSTTNNRFIVDSLIVRNVYFAENGGLADGANFDDVGVNFGQEAAFAARGSNIVVGSGSTTATGLFTALPTVGAGTSGASFDWSPSGGSPIATGGLSTFTGEPRISARVGAFITPTAYRGAAAPGGAKWWEGWTNYARN